MLSEVVELISLSRRLVQLYSKRKPLVHHSIQRMFTKFSFRRRDSETINAYCRTTALPTLSHKVYEGQLDRFVTK